MTIATETSLRTGWSREQFWCFATQLKSLFCRTLTRNSPENWSSCSQIKKSLRMIGWLYIYLASYLWLIYLCIIPIRYINKGIWLVKHDSFQSGRKIIHLLLQHSYPHPPQIWTLQHYTLPKSCAWCFLVKKKYC